MVRERSVDAKTKACEKIYYNYSFLSLCRSVDTPEEEQKKKIIINPKAYDE